MIQFLDGNMGAAKNRKWDRREMNLRRNSSVFRAIASLKDNQETRRRCPAGNWSHSTEHGQEVRTESNCGGDACKDGRGGQGGTTGHQQSE